MAYKTHILRASGRLESFVSDISEVIDKTLILMEEKLTVNVDIVVIDHPHGVIPEVGLGGYAPSQHLLYVYTDPVRPDFKETIHKELPRRLAHELHHNARWASVGYGETLLEAIVSEGLAEHFDTEMNGGKPNPWAVALNKEQISELLEKAKVYFDDKKYNHSDWFFGSEKENIPRWTGYSLGFHVVSDYLNKSGKKASELVNTEARSFV